MQVRGLGEINAIGFDIDGTLYAPRYLHVRMALHFFRYNQLFLKYGFVRRDMHKLGKVDNFMEVQDALLAKRIGCSVEDARERLQRIVYHGLGKFFKSIPPRKYVHEAFKAFRDAGLKIGILSDFPPEQKGDLWGLREYCDVLLGTESTGALKPSSHPFLVMAEKLDVAPEHILYVGNSVKYDVRGAKNAGMKTALIEPRWHTLFGCTCKEADISFNTYRQLRKIVLQ
ncbi:MAG: HAD family hydrolase [Treponema sp.]|nr:HAD family hydrolase [Treponema sp.]